MQTVCVCAAFAPAEMLMCLCGDVFLPFFPRSNYIVASLIGRNVVLEEKKKCFGYTSLEFFCFMLVYISWGAPIAVVITIPSSNSGLESFSFSACVVPFGVKEIMECILDIKRS